MRGEEEGDTRKTRRIPQKRKDVKKDGGTKETRGERLVKHSKYICFDRCGLVLRRHVSDRLLPSLTWGDRGGQGLCVSGDGQTDGRGRRGENNRRAGALTLLSLRALTHSLPGTSAHLVESQL